MLEIGTSLDRWGVIVAKVDELLARCATLESKLGQAQVAGRQLTAAVLHSAVG